MANQLIENLAPKVSLIAEIITNRLTDANRAGKWYGYKSSERLQGEQINDTDILWRRPRYGDAVTIVTRGIYPSAGEIEITDRKVVANDLVDRYSTNFYVPIEFDPKSGGVKEITKKISHTFTKLQTHDQAFTQSLNVEFTEQLQVGSPQLTFANSTLTAKQQFQASWNDKYGSSETKSDTVETSITVVPPVNIKYDAVRRREKVEVTVAGHTDFEFTIEFYDNTPISNKDLDIWKFLGGQRSSTSHPAISLGWSSLSEFIRVVSGNAPKDRHLAPEFTKKPEVDSVVNQLKNKVSTANFTYIEDNVNSQDISAVPSNVIPDTN